VIKAVMKTTKMVVKVLVYLYICKDRYRHVMSSKAIA